MRQRIKQAKLDFSIELSINIKKYNILVKTRKDHKWHQYRVLQSPDLKLKLSFKCAEQQSNNCLKEQCELLTYEIENGFMNIYHSQPFKQKNI